MPRRPTNRLAERLSVEIANHHSGSTPVVTASLGLEQYEAGDTPEMLIRWADQALYKVTILGHNRAVPEDRGQGR